MKLENFDNDCYTLKEEIKQSIKSIFKNSIKNYGMSEDVETLFKKGKKSQKQFFNSYYEMLP